MLEALAAHRLGYAGDFVIDDGKRGLWCNVAQPKARAAGSDDQLHRAPVRPAPQVLRDTLEVVRYDFVAGDLGADGGEELLDDGSGGVNTFATRALVGCGEYGGGERHDR